MEKEILISDGINVIPFTKVSLPYGWLGNMSSFPILYKDKVYKSSEALFQSLRFNDEEIIEKIRSEKSPFTAKLVAKSFYDKMSLKPLSEEDLDNMKLCIQLKFDQNVILKQMLLNTDNSIIIEDVTKRGNTKNNLFWGGMLIQNKWIGSNVLGNIIMEYRNNLK